MPSKTGEGIGLQHSWDFGESNWNTGMDSNLIKLDALVFLSVISATTVTEPELINSGDRYILPFGAIGENWAGNSGKIGLVEFKGDELGNQWTFYEPKYNFRATAKDTNQEWIFINNAWELIGNMYGKYQDDAHASENGIEQGGIYINIYTGALTVRGIV